MADQDFEEAKAFLQKNNADGKNVYDHLSEVLLKVLTERTDDAVGSFENISTVVKQDALPALQTEGTVASDQAAKEKNAAWVAGCSAHYRGKEPDEDGEGGGAPPECAPGAVQDLLDEANALSWAGVSFGRSETFRLFSAMKANAEKTAEDGLEVGQIRLFGKMLGKGADYYVFEAESKNPEGDGDEDQRGTNARTYWAASSSTSDWVRLPPVSPAQICQARQNRRFLTGDLGAPVPGYPRFAGNEAEYLRAQIACITADTQMCPSGKYVLDEAGEMSPSDEDWAAGAKDATDAGTWCHRAGGINDIGRTTTLPAEQDDDGNETSAEVEGGRALLTAMDEADWTVRACNGMACFRSSRWPGASVVGLVGAEPRCVNVYVGYGQPAMAETYTPAMPPPIQGEFDDFEFKEQDDVTEDPTPPVEEPAEGEEDDE